MVPMTTPAAVSDLRSRSAARMLGESSSTGTLERPKSMSLTTSSGPRDEVARRRVRRVSSTIMMFRGLMSRWMMPFWCTAPSASAIWRTIFTERSAASGPRSRMSRSVVPRMNSRTRKHEP